MTQHHPLDWDPFPAGRSLSLPESARSLPPEIGKFYILYDVLWGAAATDFVHEVTLDVESFADDEDLDTAQSHWNIHWISSQAGLASFNHLVLPDYDAIIQKINTDMLKALHGDLERHGTIIVGQPGIGKTRSQAFVLFYRLKHCLPTIILEPVRKKYILFTEQGVTVHDDTPVALEQYIIDRSIPINEIVLLYDAAVDDRPRYDVWGMPWWTVLTTSPEATRYKRWVTQRGASKFWMAPNTWSQIFLILTRMDGHAPTSPAVIAAREAFCDGGPVIRTCRNAAMSDPEAWVQFLADREVDIQDLITSPDLARLVDNRSAELSSMAAHKQSHKIFIAVPTLPLRHTATLRHASLTVSDKLLEIFKRQQSSIALHIWGTLSQLEGTGSFSGSLYEAAVRACCVRGERLPTQDAVKALEYADGDGDGLPAQGDVAALLHPGAHVYRYTTMSNAADLIWADRDTDGDTTLIPRAKNQATFDLFRVTWSDDGAKKKVSLVLYQITVGEKHDLKSTALHDLWDLFLFTKPFSDVVSKLEIRLVFVVPPNVSAKWTKAVVPKNLTTEQQTRREKKGKEVYDGNVWRKRIAQYVVTVDMVHMLRPTGASASTDASGPTGASVSTDASDSMDTSS